MSGTHSDLTLLLVEDDDVDAMTVERSFAKQKIGNKIIRACDGIEALELLRQNKIPSPFIILLDLKMPRMDGFEFLSHLRADPELKSSIVFVLTTSNLEKDKVSSYKENVAGYFIKEFVGENFVDIVNVLNSYWKIVQFPEKQ